VRTIRIPKICMVLALSLGALPAFAQGGAKLSPAELAERLNGVEASDITDSPIPGVYQVSVGSNVAYVTHDGRFILDGEIIDIETSENLTERTRAKARVNILSNVDRKSMIVFSPPSGEVKHTITIFTDIDCGYCRQFHREIEKVTAMGIEVHYLFYPRTGPNTESWDKAVKVWCADDRNVALTRAKLGGAVPEKSCSDTPVDAHFAVGRAVGVRGTPAIFAENGELIGGYLPPAQLAERLEQVAQR
jgi:thiol:disulfide interchange protein DsbC